jgi:hypothetical protein
MPITTNVRTPRISRCTIWARAGFIENPDVAESATLQIDPLEDGGQRDVIKRR